VLIKNKKKHMIDRAIEFIRHLITFVLLLWNFRLNQQNEQVMKLNLDLLEALPPDSETKTTPQDHGKQARFPVEIDFDEASIAWRKNKIDKGNGQFKYRSKSPDLVDDHPESRCPEVPHRYNTRLAKRIRNHEGDIGFIPK